MQSPIPGMGSKVFENLDASDLVRMMLKLELCYEQDPSDPNSLLLIPSILEEGRGKPQKWQLSMQDCVYAGRHLECDDSSHMFLTPGFFFFLWVFHLLDFLTLFHCQWITRIKEELTLQVLFLLHFSLKGHCAHPHPLFFLHFLLHLSPFLSMFHYYIISLSGFCWFGVFLMKSLCLSGVSGFGNYVCVLFEVF